MTSTVISDVGVFLLLSWRKFGNIQYLITDGPDRAEGHQIIHITMAVNIV